MFTLVEFNIYFFNSNAGGSDDEDMNQPEQLFSGSDEEGST